MYLVNSLIGASVLSLTLTYLMQVYSALQRRNALARDLDMLSAQTGDAAELLAGIGAERQFQSGYTHLATLAAAMISVKESHHLYPVLLYFRFPDPLYSVSRMCVVTLDLVTLIKSALDSSRAARSKESMASSSRVPVRAHAVLKSPQSTAVEALPFSGSPSEILHSTVAECI